LELIVEVGTAEQKELIKAELAVFEAGADYFQPPLNLSAVIVPADFDATVNHLQNTTSYTSIRVHVALAKTIEIDDGLAIVLSPYLFTEDWDHQMRSIIYYHELIHVVNKRRFPQPITCSPTILQRFENLYLLFDEYDANRLAFELTDGLYPSKSDRFRAYIKAAFEGHLGSLLDDSIDFRNIKAEIAKFRLGFIDVGQFLENIKEHFDHAAKDVVYAFSYIDHYPEFEERESDLLKSKFVNKKTIVLIDFFRSKYDETDPDLLDGLDFMGEFMTNFGMSFKDIPQGQYCHVLDI
jgi:hypothetical protein